MSFENKKNQQFKLNAMQGIKSMYSVDKLKICYQIKPLTYNKLTENPSENQFFVFKSPNPKDLYTEDFRLRRVKNSKYNFQILIPDQNVEGEFSLYGDLTIKANDDIDFAGKCFIKIENKRFYDPFEVYHAKTFKTQYNTIFFLEEMVNRLGLELVSVSSLDIAYDSNINFVKLLRKSIADENFIPVINSRKYFDLKEILKKVVISYSSTRKRAVNASITIKQTKGRLELLCYNKSREIVDESGKTYIYKWLNMNKNIHRMEIKAKREQINSFCKKEAISLAEFVSNLHTGVFLEKAFKIWLDRVIHFKNRNKLNGKNITVFDLAILKRKNIKLSD